MGIFLDFVWLTTRPPHGAYVRGARRNRIDPHGGEIERLTTRTFDLEALPDRGQCGEDERGRRGRGVDLQVAAHRREHGEVDRFHGDGCFQRLAPARLKKSKSGDIFRVGIFFLTSFGSPHVRPVRRTFGKPNGIELTPIGVV